MAMPMVDLAKYSVGAWVKKCILLFWGRVFYTKSVCAWVPSCFNCVRLFVTLWTVSHQSPLSIGFSRQEYWSVLPCYPPGDLFYPEIKPTSLMSPVLAGGFSTTSTTWEAHLYKEMYFENSIETKHVYYHM